MGKKKRGKRTDVGEQMDARLRERGYTRGQERFDSPESMMVITDENRAFMDYRRAINRWDRIVGVIMKTGTKEELDEFMRENPEPVRPPGVNYESGSREFWPKKAKWEK